MRVQTILTSGWADTLYVRVPTVFYETGWNLYLPQGMNSIILSVATFIFQGYTKSEIFRSMEEEAQRLEIQPFPLEQEELVKEHYPLYMRERWCESILERASLRYPTTIHEMVQLLIDVGILIEVKYRELMYLDLILQPFPRPEELLLLTKKESDEARQKNHRSSWFHKGGEYRG
jgi:hypothetical protein